MTGVKKLSRNERRGGGSAFRESVWKRAMGIQGKWKRKRQEMENGHPDGYDGRTGEGGRAALKHSMVENAAGARKTKRARYENGGCSGSTYVKLGTESAIPGIP